MKRFLSLLFVFILLLNIVTPYSSFANSKELILSGEAALLMDYDSEVILYEKNIHKELYPASTTKMLTGILAIENSDLDEIVTVDDEVVELTYGSHIALDNGEKLSVKDLLHGLLITSANDAALALGKNVTGSLDEFVQMMNDKAKELGAKNTNFVNPNGLHEDEHVSSAYDLALMGKYAMENETFRDIVKKATYTINPTNKKEDPRELYSTNKFLHGIETMELDGEIIPIKYNGISGVKTGYTSHAKNCLVTFAEKDGRRLLVVVLKSDAKQVYADTYKLLNHGFNDFNNHFVGYANEFIDNINVQYGKLPFVPAVLEDNVSYLINNDDFDKVEKKIKLDEDLKAPIRKGDTVGTLEYYIGDKLIGKGNIISTMAVQTSIFAILTGFLISRWYIVLAVLLLLFIIIIVSRIRARRKKKRRAFRYSSYIKQ